MRIRISLLGVSLYAMVPKRVRYVYVMDLITTYSTLYWRKDSLRIIYNYIPLHCHHNVVSSGTRYVRHVKAEYS